MIDLQKLKDSGLTDAEIKDARRLDKNAYNRAQYREKKDHFRAVRRAYYERTKKRASERSRVRYQRNKTTHQAKHAEWVVNNKEKMRGYYRKYYYRNIDKFRERYHRTKARGLELQRIRQRKIRATPRGRVDHRMKSAIYQVLRGAKAGRMWERLVGYSVDDLVRHIEINFGPGMNWDLLMNGHIHIDHKIPKSKFDYSSPDEIDFKRCWALENLQPMWAADNLSKNARILEPTQISLGV